MAVCLSLERYLIEGGIYSKLSNNHNLLGVEIHKDRFSLDTTHLFIITTRKTWFYDLASALFTGHTLPLLNMKRKKQSVSYKSAVSERSTVTQ